MQVHAASRPDFPSPSLTNEQLEDTITELAACITVATARLLSLIAELDRREAWGGAGLKSCAHWLNWKCGIGMTAAREKVRVARALESLPLISESFASGEISYSKVRAMTRVATEDNEDYLLMIARHGTASHIEDLVRGYRRVVRHEASAASNEAYGARHVHWHWDEDGCLMINARLPAEAVALVLKALEAAEDRLDDDPSLENASAESFSESHPAAQRRADALTEIATQYLSGDSSSASTSERYQVVVNVTPHDLGNDADDETSVENGPALCTETARRLGCDSSLRYIHWGEDGEPLNVGRRTRVVPSAIRKALHARDNGCRFPGCTSRRHVDAHHVRHWADGGETSLDNLVLLCRHHHRLVHEGGFDVRRGTNGTLSFTAPDGTTIPPSGPVMFPGITLADVAAASGKNVSAESLLPDWSGERMDLGLAVDGLIRCGPVDHFARR